MGSVALASRLLIFAAALCAATGCATSGSDLPAAQPPSEAGPPQTLTADLPAPSTLRLPQGVLSHVYHTGGDFMESWPRARVWVDDESIAEYRPLEDMDPFWEVMVYQPAFAIYRFDATGFPHASTLTVDWLRKGTSGDAWVGLADFETSAWHWYHPNEEGMIHFDAGACLDDGVAYALVIVNGTSRWQLKCIHLGFELAPLISGISPIHGEEGAEVEFAARLNIPAELVTTWLWDFAGAGSTAIASGPTPTLTLENTGIHECNVKAWNAWGETEYPFLLTVNETSGDWHYAAVGTSSGMNSPTSLALAPGGAASPHISYFDSASPSGRDLKRACRDGGFWLTETVAVRAHTISSSSLALGADGAMYLAYTIEETPAWDDHRNVMLAHTAAGAWEHTLLAQFVRPYDLFIIDHELVEPSLALGSGGSAGVCYEDRRYEELIDELELVSESVKFKGQAATETLVTADPEMLAGHAAAMDTSGNPGVVYVLNDVGYGLHYAVRTGTDTWTDEVVIPSQCVGPVALEFASADGQPRICFVCNVGPGDWIIRVARFDGASWDISVVPGTGDVSTHMSMALDSEGRAHICYKDKTEGALYYAMPHNLGWDVVCADDHGNVGQGCDIAVDSDDRVHLSYFDYTHNCVKYAWQPAS